jgi:NAD(P)-dependent dehydrogenase (short-subunit alcohol dehydrogenase family)
MKSYDGAVVIVTGASTGLGRAIAIGAAREGARAVVINYASSADQARETAEQVEAAGAEAILARGDVANAEDCHSVVSSALPFARVDALFNNAGVLRPLQPTGIEGLTAEDFLDTYKVSVVGAFQMVQAGQKLLEASPRAAVVNTSSLAGVTGLSSSIAYAAAKGGLNTMTRSLARALAPKVRVNSICPGFIDTPWFTKDGMGLDVEQLRASVRANSPLQLVARGEDVAESALFLASPATRLITGETLVVDGGMHLR